jgi:spore coat protein A, manganese oxidase
MMTRWRVTVGLLGAGAVAFGPALAATSANAAAPVPGTTPALTQFTETLPVPPDISPAGGYPNGTNVTLHEIAGTHTFGHQVTGNAPVTAPSFAYSPTTDPTGINQAFPNGPYLGPTLEAQRNSTLNLTVQNDLQGLHPMNASFDNTIPGWTGGPWDGQPATVNPNDTQTALHLHGGSTPVASDGGPTSVFGPGDSYTYTYKNDQEAAGLWFHDHAMGLTRFNPMLGLAGNYLIRDSLDTGVKGNPRGLPYGFSTAPGHVGEYGNDSGGRPYEMPLVVQDRMFNATGNGLNYPTQQTAFHPIWEPESFGDTPVINGQAYPNAPVDAAVYRFRIVNGSQARFYNITLVDANKGNPANVPMYQIGSEGGLLNAPVLVGSKALPSLLIAPGERADVLIDFTKAPAGAKYQFSNNAAAPYPTGPASVRRGGVPLPGLMQFTVNTTPPTGLPVDAVTTVPTVLRSGPDAIPPAAVGTGTGIGSKITTSPRVVFLNEAHDPAGLPTRVLLNNLSFPDSIKAIQDAKNDPRGQAAPLIASPTVDTVEEWDIVNTTVDAHPIHLHATQFQVLNRQPFNATKYLAAVNPLLPLETSTGTPTGAPVAGTGVTNGGARTAAPAIAPYLSGNVTPPVANETGWKDTVKAPPGTVTRILVPFGGSAAGIPAAFTGSVVTAPGEFLVWHCHILEHEENDMMQAYQILNKP